MCNRFENMSKQIRAQCPTKLTRRVAVETVRQLFQLFFFFWHRLTRYSVSQ